MCENRDGKFVVPKLPSARMGWWVGQSLFCGQESDEQKKFVEVILVWVQHPEYAPKDSRLVSTTKHTKTFDDISEALAHLSEKGVITSIPA